MDYKSSKVIFLKITSRLLTFILPSQDLEKRFFEIYFLKVTGTSKSLMLIMNIAVSKFKNLVLKTWIIFSYMWILDSKPSFDPHNYLL
jgi:hypothetical protein